jgi:hypothetical protein
MTTELPRDATDGSIDWSEGWPKPPMTTDPNQHATDGSIDWSQGWPEPNLTIAPMSACSVSDLIDGRLVPRPDAFQRQWSEGYITGTPPASGDNPTRPSQT